MADQIHPVRHRRPRGRSRRPPATGCAAPAGPSPRRSTTGRRASRSPTCRSCAATGPTSYDWRAAEARLNALPAVPHRDRRARHPLPARPLARTPTRCRSSSPTAGPVRSSSSTRSSARSPTRRRTAATPPTRSTSSARRCPGYGFSDKPTRDRAGTSQRIADAWAELMARLGYDRYGAQGGDWGASGDRRASASSDPEHVVGIHLNMPIASPTRHARRPDRRRSRRRSTRSTALRNVGGRVLDAAVDPAADARLRAGRLAGRPVPRGSSRSSGRGPTATATPRTSSPATSCSTT